MTDRPRPYGDLDTGSPGYAVHREGKLELLCNADSEEETPSILRTLLGTPLSRHGFRVEELSAEEVGELAAQVKA